MTTSEIDLITTPKSTKLSKLAGVHRQNVVTPMGRWPRARPRQMGGISGFHAGGNRERSQTQTVRGPVDTHWCLVTRLGRE